MKKLLSFLLPLAVVISSACAQTDPVAQKYGQYVDTLSALARLSVIASDAFEGRETGTPGATRAAEYLAGEFRKIGLTGPVNGSYFQKVALLESRLHVDRFQINGTSLTYGTDFYIRSFPLQKIIKSGEIVFAGYGISDQNYDDFKGVDVEGKVVMVFSSGEPVMNGRSVVTGTAQLSKWSTVASKRLELLKSKKPALILSVNDQLGEYLAARKGHLQEPVMSVKSDQTEQGIIPVISLTPETANQMLKSSGKTITALKTQISRSGRPASGSYPCRLEISLRPESKDIQAVNVLGYLEGTDLKEELLVVSAHYDHVGLNPGGQDTVFNGADDDGSGTTAVLELAEAFAQAKKEGKSARRSILFLLVVGEEKGLLGSQWYSEYPVFPLKNTIADLNIDMIGRVDSAHLKTPGYCYLIGSDKLSTDLHRISEQANATYTNLKLDYKYNDPNDPERIYYRSDHYNFAKHNIPIIFYFNGVHEDYHQTSDELAKINFPLLVKRAKLVFFTAWELVNRDQRPKVDVHKE